MSQEVIRVADRYYVLSTSPRVDDRTRVLKHGDTFGVFDRWGDIDPFGSGELGLYHRDTRYLSRFSLRLDGARPWLLSSTIKEDNALLAADLTNPDVRGDGVAVPRGTVHLFRAKFLWQGRCYERLRVHNYGLEPLELRIAVEFDADFADIFEVRGLRRARRGRALDPVVEGRAAVLGYEGLDGRVRRTRIAFDPVPESWGPQEARYTVRLAPRGEFVCVVVVSCDPGPREPEPTLSAYESAFADAGAALRAAMAEDAHVYTSNEQFNDWWNRSRADLHLMATETPHGPYPYAGVPWFSTVFGRDGLVTAFETLWANPAFARGVLGHLAATQAEEEDAERDAQPGKILHEARAGEMAALGEIPFGRYYGSVDATPLFVWLAGAYYARTGDRALVERLWPHVDRALRWMDTYGDPDGDGFLEYARRSPRGLVNQGWKDSPDAVFHADGALAEPPIALCEVQAYAYGARRAAAALARVLGDGARAEAEERRARELRARFDEAFWCDGIGTYALALDGSKRPCQVRASNAGQCLLTGIARPERARRVAEILLGPDGFSGYGIRTVAASEARYNPLSYHNGSVWPHDNALIAYGFARYGLKEAALRVLTALFDASLFVDLHRLPELFCGLPRRPGEGPTLYPVACAPQSWAAGAVFLLLQAALGLSVDAEERRILFAHPALPEFLQTVEIRGLRMGDASVDLVLERHPADVGLRVLRREGDVEIVVVK
jgi:glycogen debranching enzyme